MPATVMIVDDSPRLSRRMRLMLGQGDRAGQVQTCRAPRAQLRFARANRLQTMPGNPGRPVRMVPKAVHAHA